MEEFERLSRRLSFFERLRGLPVPPLPLNLVLVEETSSILLLLASLPEGAQLIKPLLDGFDWLLQESAGVRLAIVRQLLMVGQDYATLSGSGLVVGWKGGKESNLWSSAQTPSLQLGEIKEFYQEIFSTLLTTRGEREAKELLEMLRTQMQGQDAQEVVYELEESLAAPQSNKANNQITTFDLDSVKALHAQIESTQGNKEAQSDLARQILSSSSPAEVAERVAQVIDTHDSAGVRSFALDLVSQSTELAPLAAAVVYARPAVGGFSFNLNTPTTLLSQADDVLSNLNKGQGGKGGGTLGRALRSAPGSAVPACQLLSLLSSNSKDAIGEARVHLSWLRALVALVEGQSDKPKELDLCWLAAYGGSGGGKEQQEAALEALLGAFDSSHPPPSALSGRGDRPSSSDPSLLRFRASWDAFYHRALELCSPDGPLTLIPMEQVTRTLLSQVLRTGDVDLFTSLSRDCALSEGALEELVLSVSTSLFDSAPTASSRNKETRLSLEVLSALPTARAKTQRDFIEASCRLTSFHIPSPTHPSQTISPKEIRQTGDKMDLIARLLATQEGAWRNPDLLLDLAKRLCGEEEVVEARCLGMLADSAGASGEGFEEGSGFCLRLVEKVNSLRQRKHASSTPATSSASSASAASATIVELAWKSCFQLSKHPGWADTPARLTLLSHAMTLAPPTQLNPMLRLWSSLDQQLQGELEEGKVFPSTTEKVEAGWGTEHFTTAAAGMGAGLVGQAANLLPLNFSPLSYFGAGVPAKQGAVGVKGEVDKRTAKLFDFDKVSGARGEGEGGYGEAGERAVRAARAARDFLGWKNKSGAEGEGGGQGGGGGGGIGGFSLSRGMGWLIGDESRP